ncbi:MAG: ribosome-associated translation inhibitor RaiA [Alphaproteobacteria bacterium]|jgi:ribosomal subunit interface protein|nr:ribosome-associated translation inhibitor RaiA [Alphaproteobacteria bacterium]
MQILVSGKQIDVGEALRGHVEERLQNGIAKYFTNPIDAHVVFSREGQGYRVDCSVHVGHGIHAQSHASAAEIYAVFDQAADRLDKRLRRYKRRLRGHHGRERPAAEQLRAQSYILAPEPEHEEASAEFQPVIVAETTSDIHSRTVGEAVMQMDLADLPVLMFRNRGNGHLNVVYRRPDRHIGWIDLVAENADGERE